MKRKALRCGLGLALVLACAGITACGDPECAAPVEVACKIERTSFADLPFPTRGGFVTDPDGARKGIASVHHPDGRDARAVGSAYQDVLAQRGWGVAVSTSSGSWTGIATLGPELLVVSASRRISNFYPEPGVAPKPVVNDDVDVVVSAYGPRCGGR